MKWLLKYCWCIFLVARHQVYLAYKIISKLPSPSYLLLSVRVLISGAIIILKTIFFCSVSRYGSHLNWFSEGHVNINSSGQKHRHLHVPQFQQILFSSNTRHSRKKFHLIKWYVFVLWCKLLKMRLYCCVAYFNNGPKTESSNLATYPSVYSMSVSSSRFFLRWWWLQHSTSGA